MKSKYVTTLIAMGVVLLFSTLPANAIDNITYNTNHDQYCNSEFLKQFGGIDRTQTITINGEENPLYCVFSDKDYALNQLKTLASDLLSEIATINNLQEIDTDNWRQYYNIALSIDMGNNSPYEFKARKGTLLSFFDIFENYDKNNEIIDYVKNATQIRVLSFEDEMTAGSLLPSYAPLAVKSQQNIQFGSQLQSQRVLPNLNAAIAYAEKYAWGFNADEYGIAGRVLGMPDTDADCTNFVSQIREKSGVSQDKSDNKAIGWWHTKGALGLHSYSNSWINANTFARYMGIDLWRKNHRDFAINIQVGDFISADFQSDGSWDHLGFITYRDNIERVYNGKTYRNYIVAQHTTNYNSWASEEINTWETIEDRGGMYGRISRLK